VRVLLPFSGGIDSTAALVVLLQGGHDVQLVTIDYGQKAGFEIESAAQIANFFHTKISKETLLFKFPKCSRIDYSLSTRLSVNRKRKDDKVFVPGLFSQIVSISHLHAMRHLCDAICLPFSVASSQFYPEASGAGITGANLIFQSCPSNPVKLFLPFMDHNKKQIFEVLLSSKFPYWNTYSCLSSEPRCGDCSKCYLRDEVIVGSQKYY